MALVHVSGRMMIGGLDVLTALLSSAMLITIGLLIGYTMLRTENVVAPAILHTVADWLNISHKFGKTKRLESKFTLQPIIQLQLELTSADNVLEDIASDASYTSLLTTGLLECDPALDTIY
jgi:membrane protease YdiL (CAAX protease family)